MMTALGLPPEIRACLFDLDGVLTDTAALHAKAWKQMFDDFLSDRAGDDKRDFEPFDEVRDYERYVDGKPRDDGTRSFLESRDIELPEGDDDDSATARTIHGLGARKNQILNRLLHDDGVDAFPGSVRYVRRVKNAGLRTAVVSSSKNCRAVLESAGISELFDVRVDGVVAADRQLAGKPEPDTYLAAARDVGVSAKQAAVFEDALAGVEAGRAGRFGFVVGVDRLDQADALKRHGANVVVEDLGALLEAV